MSPHKLPFELSICIEFINHSIFTSNNNTSILMFVKSSWNMIHIQSSYRLCGNVTILKELNFFIFSTSYYTFSTSTNSHYCSIMIFMLINSRTSLKFIQITIFSTTNEFPVLIISTTYKGCSLLFTKL
jgi:hypothetical protein